MLGQNADMPSLTLSNRLIWFAHCPKAGGTSIEQAMVATWGSAVGHLHWGWDLWWRREGHRTADPPNSPQHLVWADACRVLPRTPDDIFAMVRDPVARMASEHRWQRRGRRATRLGRTLAYLPFALWVRVMICAAQKNPHVFDNHFRPQSDFVPATAITFRLEDGLTPALNWLRQITDEPTLPACPPHAIPSGAGKPVGACEAGLIGEAFHEDHKRFGYPRQTCKHRRVFLDKSAKALAPLINSADGRGWL